MLKWVTCSMYVRCGRTDEGSGWGTRGRHEREGSTIVPAESGVCLARLAAVDDAGGVDNYDGERSAVGRRRDTG